MWERVMLQPLDLEGIESKILEEIVGKRQYKLVVSDKEVIRTTLLEVRKHLKSACEFYLRYKDKPHLLIQEHPKYEKQARKFLDDVEKYNDWLFKLAFGGVLG